MSIEREKIEKPFLGRSLGPRVSVALDAIWTEGPKGTRGAVEKVNERAAAGGRLPGVAPLLKARKPSFEAITVEPAGSPVLSGGDPRPRKIQGRGAGFIPELLERSLIDQVLPVTKRDALELARRLAREKEPAGWHVPGCGSARAAAVRTTASQQQEGNHGHHSELRRALPRHGSFRSPSTPGQQGSACDCNWSLLIYPPLRRAAGAKRAGHRAETG